MLDEFNKKIESSDIEGAKKTADDFKNLISDSTVYKVVFMPYKASMWDSLESVWMAADKDKRWEAVVVPITHYELENDRPDIIYIHNPYDDTNRVTSVESRYYSCNLKKYCEKIVYIPYYKWVDGVSSPSFKPAMYYVDYTVHSSDDAVKRCIDASSKYAELLGMENIEVRNAMESKLINLGSTKVDKVVSLHNEKMGMPGEWEGKIRKDKVNVVYNTTIDEILKSRSLEKVMSTLSYFKFNIYKSFAIWRPYPLLKQTLVSMIPGLVHGYDEMVEIFSKGDYGVIDNNASMYYSMY